MEESGDVILFCVFLWVSEWVSELFICLSGVGVCLPSGVRKGRKNVREEKEGEESASAARTTEEV